MKKCILSALAGALAMLVVIIIAATIYAKKDQPPKDYEHIDYVSTITGAECHICSDNGDYTVSAHWGEDNVGIVNLNTFEMMRLEINRYSERGELIEEFLTHG